MCHLLSHLLYVVKLRMISQGRFKYFLKLAKNFGIDRGRRWGQGRNLLSKEIAHAHGPEIKSANPATCPRRTQAQTRASGSIQTPSASRTDPAQRFGERIRLRG